jgi:hypothetical protein
MSIEVVDRVSTLIGEAKRIESESETIYLELGSIFPRLSAEMGQSADNGERSLQSIASIGEADLAAGRAEGGSFAEKALAFFNSLRDRDSAFLAKINDSISRLGAMDQIIARVRADSEEMEIISLNAMTVALKSGAAGKAFSVITDELKRLSGLTIVLAEGVTTSGRSLLDFFSRLRGALAELDDFQHGFFDAIDETLISGYEEIGRDISGATSFLSTLLGEARSVREPVLHVMGEVQLQDIVRQSLQHVGISLEEARESALASDAESAAFVAAVAELSQSLIEDVTSKLEASAASFGADMDAVSAIVNESEKGRAGFLESSCARSSNAEAFDFKRRSERYLELKRVVVTMSARLADQVEGLFRSFKGLASILSRFQNIVVASRIEVAKTKALAVVATTVSGMIDLTGQIEADVGEAMESTKSFTALSSEAIEEYSLEGGAEGERLVSTLAAVEEDMARLFSAKDSLRGAIDHFSLYTDDFISLIGSAGEELAKLRSLIDRLVTVGASLGELKSSIRAGLDPGATAIESERMRRMVERFTIFTHKKAAGAIGRFAVEEGQAAGEVTLFR